MINRLKQCVAMILTAVCMAGILASNAEAVEATLMKAQLTRDEPGEKPGLFVAASYEFDLPEPLIEALHRGIPLYFIHEFNLYKNRWYWLDKLTQENRFIIRLAYSPLTRRYRLSYDGISHNFDSLEHALPMIKNIRRWRVAPWNAIKNKNDYEAEIRFYLDTSRLPKPMQVTNTGNNDWTVISDWSMIPIPSEVVDEQ